MESEAEFLFQLLQALSQNNNEVDIQQLIYFRLIQLNEVEDSDFVEL